MPKSLIYAQILFGITGKILGYLRIFEQQLSINHTKP